MGNGFLGFVAHVGKAEALTFDFTVAAVDDEVMSLAQVAHEFRHVDAAVIFDAGKGGGAKIFFGEKFKITFTHQVVDERICPGVTSKTSRQSFSKNIFKL